MPLREYIQRSRATPAFLEAVAAFGRAGDPNERVRFDRYAPPVKVERTLTKLLEEYPDLPIERVEIEGSSGCEFFRGMLTVHAGEETRRIAFHWNCRWKAEQLGWRDYFGFADQTRAAREFGHDCFQEWAERVSAPIPAQG
jgi:hypothetical protein